MCVCVGGGGGGGSKTVHDLTSKCRLLYSVPIAHGMCV